MKEWNGKGINIMPGYLLVTGFFVVLPGKAVGVKIVHVEVVVRVEGQWINLVDFVYSFEHDDGNCGFCCVSG